MSDISRRLAALTLAVLLCLSVVAPVTTATARETPSERFEVSLHEDGSADVTLSVTYDLDDENERDAFEQLKDDRQARERFETRFRDRMRGVARDAANATGREMAISNASVSLETVGDTGVVELSVVWVGLAAVDGDRLTVREPFASGFESDRAFRLVAPDGYEVTGATPDPDRRDGATLTWEAGTSLDGFEATVDGSDGGTDNGNGTADETAGDGPGFGVAATLVALAALVGLAARRQ